MKQKYDRREDIIQFIRPHMEERFQESCREIQKKLEEHGSVMWNEVRELIQEILENTVNMQERNRKGKIAYFVCSFLQSGVYLNRLLLRMETLDEGFYLDKQEIVDYYFPQLLQDNYLEDLGFLNQKVYGEFARVQNHELDEISKVYTEYYNALMFKIVQDLSSLIMRTVMESEVSLSDDFQIIYGEYMGSATVLCVKEKSENEVFPNQNG